MAMKSVTMDEVEWGSVMNILGNTTAFPWTVTNPLLMKIGQQLAPGQEAGTGLPAALPSRVNGPDPDAPASGSRPRGGLGNRSNPA